GDVDGLVSEDNQLFGTYLHGIFDLAETAQCLCQWAGAASIEPYDHRAIQEQAINRIADAIEQHLNLDLLWPDL
ncbi:MAG: cobyric acid synthase, partial [Vibrio sp.]